MERAEILITPSSGEILPRHVIVSSAGLDGYAAAGSDTERRDIVPAATASTTIPALAGRSRGRSRMVITPTARCVCGPSLYSIDRWLPRLRQRRRLWSVIQTSGLGCKLIRGLGLIRCPGTCSIRYRW